MDRFARIVLGFHGCDPEFADALISGETPVEDWEPSRNAYDWLGEGIYFWEHAPDRARTWGGKGGVVGAVIQLGNCLDLTETAYTRLLGATYDSLRETYLARGEALPQNKGKRRTLDRLVIDELATAAAATGVIYQTARCPFLEGDPAFPGSGIRRESHIQLAVRDRSCIIGVFRPNLA
jgi:hypothetical protein